MVLSQKEMRKSKPLDVRDTYIKTYKDYEKDRKSQIAKRNINILEKRRRYDSSKLGRLSRAFTGGIRKIKSPTKALYSNQQLMSLDSPQRKPQTISGSRGGGRGRPRGSYDRRYAEYGGVYGYRKALSARLALLKASAMRQSQVSPDEERVIQSIQQRRQAQLQSPESKTIPDTYGSVPLKGLMDEIDRATNLFG
jgi:hypothetical protein